MKSEHGPPCIGTVRFRHAARSGIDFPDFLAGHPEQLVDGVNPRLQDEGIGFETRRIQDASPDVPATVDGDEFSQFARVDFLFNVPAPDVETFEESDHENGAALIRLVDEPVVFIQTVGQQDLAEDVFAPLKRGEGDFGVPVHLGDDVDGFHVGIPYQVSIVRIMPGYVVCRGDATRAFRRAGADRREFDMRKLGKDTGVLDAETSQTDDTDSCTVHVAFRLTTTLPFCWPFSIR